MGVARGVAHGCGRGGESEDAVGGIGSVGVGM